MYSWVLTALPSQPSSIQSLRLRATWPNWSSICVVLSSHKIDRLLDINYIPYFSSEGRYAYAVLAVGVENAGDKSFYGSLNDGNLSNDFSSGYAEKMDTHEDVDSHHDEGAANL